MDITPAKIDSLSRLKAALIGATESGLLADLSAAVPPSRINQFCDAVTDFEATYGDSRSVPALDITPGDWTPEFLGDHACIVTHADNPLGIATVPWREGQRLGEHRANVWAICAMPAIVRAVIRAIEAFPEIGTDDELNGGDAVERLGEVIPILKSALDGARATGMDDDDKRG